MKRTDCTLLGLVAMVASLLGYFGLNILGNKSEPTPQTQPAEQRFVVEEEGRFTIITDTKTGREYLKLTTGAYVIELEPQEDHNGEGERETLAGIHRGEENRSQTQPGR